MADLRATTESEKNYLKAQIIGLANAVRMIEMEAKQQERELIHRMTLDHELELNDVRKSLMSKDEEIESLRSEKHSLEISQLEVVEQYENSNAKLRQTIETLQTRLKEAELQCMNAANDKERAVCDARDKLIHEHKTEMESLRCRFKLMTSMERSPSDTSLEKIDRPAEYIELANHESILLQTREDLAAERELAIRSAIERERARFESRNVTSTMFMSTSPKSPTTSQDLYKRILEEKDRQIDELHRREQHLTKENQRFKETIQTLADSEPCDEMSVLKCQFDELTRDNRRLQQALDAERSKRAEMERSVTAIKSESIESSRPRSTRRSNSQTMLARASIALDSCTKGDHVLVVWSRDHERYTVLQESPIVYFLHGDSYEALGLTSSPSSSEGGQQPTTLPKVIHCLGVVLDKEYCQARKDGNRYRVAKGTKFYRVKVNPVRVDEKNVGGGNAGTKSRKERPENVLPSSSSESVSRSTSTEQCANQPFHFIDSCAQTEMLLDPVLEDTMTTSESRQQLLDEGKDMIDSGVVTQQKSCYKDRNESVTEVDEDQMMLDDHPCHYVSVSEEEEIVGDDLSRNEEVNWTFNLFEY